MCPADSVLVSAKLVTCSPHHLHIQVYFFYPMASLYRDAKYADSILALRSGDHGAHRVAKFGTLLLDLVEYVRCLQDSPLAVHFFCLRLLFYGWSMIQIVILF